MDWLEKMNRAVEYVEENIEGEIDLEKAAATACCSLSHFQRLFSFLADASLSEYIRGRRLAAAGAECAAGDARVIDLALKYGYESPEAFTRAFRLFHGASPSRVKSGEARIKCYPRAAFTASTKGGGVFMGSKTLVRIEELAPGRAASFKAFGKDPEDSAWELLRKWAARWIADCACRRCMGYAPRGHHPDGSDAHAYTAQIQLVRPEGDGAELHGADVTDSPVGLFMVSDAPLVVSNPDSGEPDIGESLKRASEIMYECMKQMGGYDLDFEGRNFLEEHLFPPEWFGGKKCAVEFRLWLPVRRV